MSTVQFHREMQRVCHFESVMEDNTASLCTGETAADMVSDIRRVTRLHVALARMFVCMDTPKSAAEQQQQQPAANAAALSRAEQQTAEPAERSLKGARTAALPEPLANGNLWSKAAQRGSRAAAALSVADGAAEQPSCRRAEEGPSAPLSWQAEEGCGAVSVSAVGLTLARLTVASPGGPRGGATPADMQQPPGGGHAFKAEPSEGSSGAPSLSGIATGQLSLSLEWASDGCRSDVQGRVEPAAAHGQMAGSSSDASSGGLRCRMTAEPALPADVLHAFEEMAGARLRGGKCQ